MKFLPNQKKRLLIFLMLILIIIITAVMLYIINLPKKINYQTVPVIRGNIEKLVLATGKLDALSKVDVGAQVSGQLQTLYVKEGDMVKKGDLLAVIDSQKVQNVVKESEETLREHQANLALARAELKLAEMTYQRYVDLAKHQAISRQEFDRVKTDVEVKKARVKIYIAQINRNQASLNTAKTNLKYTHLTAPLSGIVTNIKTLQGQTVIASQEAPTIMTLADLDTMLVKAQVSEADIINLKSGQKASFTILGAPDKTFAGVLKDILPTPEEVNDAIFYYARFEVPNPHHILKLQMTAQIKIQLALHKNVLLLPLSALRENIANNQYIVVLLQNGQQVERRVEVATQNYIDAEIVSGLAEGDLVITNSEIAKG
ncbi:MULTISPECIES: macrolide transporter subunit MacA [unclassified Arsenophonus]|uniref:macrolide transporter subunit MacA n=1 Tax=unclassified Arsenophonus TaxID=2627083 RepID=UPI002855AED9|nr:macrolide transporter subunit MacA [Arsenophonus sp.]MDR5609070.1 macrolide transporter subunit MacA [Arsenophonus sp.]MDR5613851.1 macrolide transporter subunit MacA [Arsenophonus sp.]